ncbi:MAG: hypothetical protein HYX87_08265 [Chloroflexi bacterium]|nr:hypothetical protein [Chloroflexota bacterium]
MSDADSAATPLQEMDFRQLRLYARDLEQLYWSERQARSSLAEEKLVREYKVCELKALNELFLKNLEEKQAAIGSYDWLLERLKQMEKTSGGADLHQLVREAEGRHPKLHDNPSGTWTLTL